MSDVGWWKLISVALGSGLTVKLLDIVYQEYLKRNTDKRSTREFVDEHLDPLLKAADELAGKIRSLAENDFHSITHVIVDDTCMYNSDFSSLVFLFGRFYAHIEVIRQDGVSVSMSSDERGLQLQKFFDCLESRRVRIVDRILQRAIGETFLNGKEQKTYCAFVASFETEAAAKRWITPLGRFLSRLSHTTERQRLLQYGTVIHALIDTLDPSHLVTRERPSMHNKLSRRSHNDLRYRVFRLYLSFVKDPTKYIGPPKRRPGKVGRQREETLEAPGS